MLKLQEQAKTILFLSQFSAGFFIETGVAYKNLGIPALQGYPSCSSGLMRHMELRK